ncbi:MAG: flagellar motor switch protein FliM [Candidatus Hydrogenedentes bacterium]|nr:flagellar motor switch protein FliM [Candidatus Hydrogenedentota bacterium]
MADILSQEEVDLLLSAVAEGDVEIGPEEQARAIADTRDTGVYDFRRPERVSKEQLKGLQSLFENFARELSIMLPPFLRTVVRVDLVSIDQLTYDEFILSVSRPTALSVVNMHPLDGNCVIELRLPLVFPIVDRILGGKGMPLSEPRELTEIENRIVHRIVLMILDCLMRSWEQLIEFKLSVETQESDPLLVQIVPGSEMTILAGYELHIGEAVGAMNMCIPLVVLNPVFDQIRKQTRFIRHLDPVVAAQTRAQITRIVRKALVPVNAILGHARMNLDDVMRLRVGDIVQVDSSIEEPIDVEIEGIVRFKAHPGRRSEQSAVQICSVVRED